MPTEGVLARRSANSLLAADEPQPYSVINPESRQALLLVCDHASCRIPAALNDLELEMPARQCHLAWDIGAGPLTLAVAARLGCTAVLAGYSRLVVDCNRQLDDPTAFLDFGDGIAIPGNRDLDAAERARRAAEIYWPYHKAIEAELARLRGESPVTMLSIHSFSPILDGITRDCQVGILWDQDRPTAEKLIEGFRAEGYSVGDNEPYSGKAPMDFTIDHHAEAAHLPHAGIEIRNDLLRDHGDIMRIADILAGIAGRIRGTME